MVSWEIRMRALSGYRRRSQPEICSGDQFWLSLKATQCCRRRTLASLHTFGRRAHLQAAASASAARYRDRPPCRATSLEIVDTGRRRPRAIARNDSLRLMPREISSRSCNVKALGLRHRGGGEIPPRAASQPKTPPTDLSSPLAISNNDCPARQRCHRAALSFASKPRVRTNMQHLFQPGL